MKTLAYLICCGLVISVAYWAYKENYRTQNSLRRVSTLQSEIAAEREAIAVLSAEWAYLNRPDRLRELVDLNFVDLPLLPLMPEHFADVELVAYPSFQIDPNQVTGTVVTRSADKEFP